MHSYARHILLPALSLSLSACGAGGGSGAPGSTDPVAKTCPSTAPAEAQSFALMSNQASDGKLQLSGRSTAILASDSTDSTNLTTELKAGTTISVVVKDACKNPGPIVSQIENRYEGRTPSGVRSYSFELPDDISPEDLATLADQDECVHRIVDENQLTLDPEETAQSESVIESPALDPEETTQSEATMATLSTDPSRESLSLLTSIRATIAYDVTSKPTGITKPVVIAIIDSGVRLTHEDLRANIWVNRDEIPNNRIDDDGNGYVDDVNGYNFASRIASPEPQRTAANGAWQWAHGTKVAGLAAAVGGNGKGGTGVDGSARIMALNAMGGSSTFSQSNIANAIRYAADNGADVINLSLGGSNASADYVDALKYAVSKGAVVLAAAGNESIQIDESYSAAGHAARLPGLISVGNIQAIDFARSMTSNYSSQYVELAAPGTHSSGLGLFTTSPASTTSYANFSGTSASTPVAAGGAALAIALIKSRGYLSTPATIEGLMLETAQKRAALQRYFKNGNTLDVGTLIATIDAKYPVRQAIAIGSGDTTETSESNSPPIPPPGGDNAAAVGDQTLCATASQ